MPVTRFNFLIARVVVVRVARERQHGRASGPRISLRILWRRRGLDT
jgi:hypothetical protein